jgi:protein gp37
MARPRVLAYARGVGQGSAIEWTDATWNPVTGCTQISPGCKHCYAERLAERLRAMGQPNYANGFALTLQPHMLELPLRWRKPRSIFVNSMSDLFHEDLPLAYVRAVFDVMARASWHRFQVLTKRSARLASTELDWPPNVWMGVSVESDAYRGRIDDLRSTGARVKFLSLEPLLGPLQDLDLARMRAGVAFFFKQWGGTNKKRTGRLLEGRTWDELPLAVG